MNKGIRRGRSALVWGLALFVCGQLSLAAAIEWRYPEFRDPESGYRLGRLAGRTAGPSDHHLTIVMLGSSRTTRGFQAGLLEDDVSAALHRPVVAYNFGVTGAGPLLELLNLRRLLSRRIRPDLLLIEVLPAALADQFFEGDSNRFQAERIWYTELGMLERYGSSTAMRTEWLTSWPFPAYVHRFAILSRLLPDFLPAQSRIDWAFQIDSWGWFGLMSAHPSIEDRRLWLQRTHKEYYHLLAGFRLGAIPCRALHELLDLCRMEEIPALLVLMPEGEQFRSWYSPGAQPVIAGYLASLGREFDVGCVDARDWFGEKEFLDSHHLLSPGAAQFTRRLTQEAVLPRLRRP